MAEQANKEFPDTCIVISTLLPRADIPPHVIHDNNMEIRRGCATLPCIHLARHPTIGTWDLYDGLHLHKERMKIFAKTLKDTLPLSPTRSPSKTSYSPSPPQDDPPCCEETQQVSLDLPLPIRPPPHHCETQPKEASFPLLSPCPPFPFTASSAELCSSTYPWSTFPSTAVELCNSTCLWSTSPPTAVELCNSTCSWSPSPPTAAELCKSTCPWLHLPTHSSGAIRQ